MTVVNKSPVQDSQYYPPAPDTLAKTLSILEEEEEEYEEVKQVDYRQERDRMFDESQKKEEGGRESAGEAFSPYGAMLHSEEPPSLTVSSEEPKKQLSAIEEFEADLFD